MGSNACFLHNLYWTGLVWSIGRVGEIRLTFNSIGVVLGIVLVAAYSCDSGFRRCADLLFSWSIREYF